MINSKLPLLASLLASIFLIDVGSLLAQPNTQKTYDVLQHDEGSYAMTKNLDDHFVLVSNNTTMEPPGSSFCNLTVVKLDSCLDTLMVRSIEPVGLADHFNFIITHDISLDGTGYVLCGEMSDPMQPGFNTPIGWAMTMDANFNPLQFMVYFNVVRLHAVLPAITGGDYLMAGECNKGAIVFATDPNLNAGIKWHRVYDGGIFYDMVRTDGNKVALTGSFPNPHSGSQDVIVHGTDDFGGSIWVTGLDYTGPQADWSNEFGKGIYFSAPDNLYITGQITSSFMGNISTDVLGINVQNGTGTELWSQRYDLGGAGTETGEKLLVGANGNIRITGNVVHSFPGSASNNGFMIEATSTGDPVEAEMYGSGTTEMLYRIEENAPNDFVMVGTKDNQIYGVQSFANAITACNDTTFALDTLPTMAMPYAPGLEAEDLWSTPAFSNHLNLSLEQDTICMGCVGCYPTAPKSTYYQVIDQSMKGVLQRMMNEGDYYSDATGNNLVFAYTDPSGGGDVVVVNVKENGELKWAYTYETSGKDEVYAVRKGSDGFYVAGISDNLGKRYPFLMKLSNSGGLQWTKTYRSGYSMAGLKMIVLTNGEVVIATSVDAWIAPENADDVAIFKTKADGTLITYKILNQSPIRDWDQFTDLVQDGNNIVAVGRGGQSSGDDYNPGLMVKFDLNLNVIWVKHYRYRTAGGTYALNSNHSTNSHVKLYAVEVVNGDYYAAGVLSDDNNYGSNGSFKDIILMKINPTTGQKMWHTLTKNQNNTKAFQGFDLRYDGANNEFLIVGNTKSGADQRSVLLRLDANGNWIWGRTYGDGKKNMANHVQIANDGKILMTGMHGKDGVNTIRPFYARLNADGTGDDVCSDVLSLQNDTLYVDSLPASRTDEIHFDYTTLDFVDEELCPILRPCDNSSYKSYTIDEWVEDFEMEEDQFTVYPNPLSDQGTIRFLLREDARVDIQLFDLVSGRLVQVVQPQSMVGPGVHQVTFNSSQLARGTYLCMVTVNGEPHPIKVVLAN